MTRKQNRCFAITLLVVLSLLFSQLALANYVCPNASAGPDEMASMVMASGQPCEAMLMAPDKEQPVLCHQHCVNAPQSVDPLQAPAVSLPAVFIVLLIPASMGDAQAGQGAYARSAEARPPPDPIFLSTLRLRV